MSPHRLELSGSKLVESLESASLLLSPEHYTSGLRRLPLIGNQYGAHMQHTQLHAAAEHQKHLNEMPSPVSHEACKRTPKKQELQSM